MRKFCNTLNPVDAVDFSTPHVSANLTTVKFSEPAPPQGAELNYRAFPRFFIKCRGVNPACGERGKQPLTLPSPHSWGEGKNKATLPASRGEGK